MGQQQCTASSPDSKSPSVITMKEFWWSVQVLCLGPRQGGGDAQQLLEAEFQPLGIRSSCAQVTRPDTCKVQQESHRQGYNRVSHPLGSVLSLGSFIGINPKENVLSPQGPLKSHCPRRLTRLSVSCTLSLGGPTLTPLNGYPWIHHDSQPVPLTACS